MKEAKVMRADSDKLKVQLERVNSLMREIIQMIEAGSALRCPYRSAQDDCTFSGRCQNQSRQAHEQFKCNGNELTDE